MDPSSAARTVAAPVAVAPARTPGSGTATAPEQAERDRHGGAVSPIPTLTPVSDFMEELKEAGKHAKPYEILGPLGKGKFAMVYKAQLGHDLYALKKVAIFEMMNQSSRDKCLKEIQLLQSLNHQNIIRYEDSYIDLATSELVIVLQWARGGDLKKLIRKVRSGQAKISEFSEGMVWKYCAQLASGLEYMHEKRVMHRDLKPANIMLSHDNQVLLGDLGLSRYFNPQTLEAFSKVGTPLYISPEVLMGTGYGFAADVWSLGCILYELCTLSSPFKPTTEGVNLYALFGNIRSGKYAPIPDDGKYSENLRALITAMIRIEPGQRPSMAQVAAVARKMVEQRAAKQAQAREAQAQAQALHAQVNGAAAATAEASAAPGTATESPPSQPQLVSPSTAAAASPGSDVVASASPTSIAAAGIAAAAAANPSPSPSPVAAAGSPSSAAPASPHLTMRFPGESPTPLTPTRRDRGDSASSSRRPLNASPLPSPSSAASARAAAEMQLASGAAAGLMQFRPVSPLSPIYGMMGRATSEENGAGTGSAGAVASAGDATSASPPPALATRPPSALVVRPTSATRPTSASARPISATHRPSSGTQRAAAAPPAATALPSAAATAASAARPSSRHDLVRPPSQSGARPSSKSSPVRPISSGSAAAPHLSAGPNLPNGVDHFPSSSSAATAATAAAPGRSISPSHARLGRAGSGAGGGASPLPGLSDSRDEDDSSAGDGEGSSGIGGGPDGRHSPAQLYRNPAAQSFLYDRTAGVSSPSLSPTAGSGSPSHSPQSAGSRFHLADPALPAVDEDAPASFRLAHMSFASSPSAQAHAHARGFGEPSPPSASWVSSVSSTSSAASEAPRPTSAATNATATAMSVRPLSRGNLGSAGQTRAHPVVALPFSNLGSPPASAAAAVGSSFSPPAVGVAGVSSSPSPTSSASPFVEEELSPMPATTPPAVPPVGMRTRSLGPEPSHDGRGGATAGSGSESSRRVKSASTDLGSPLSLGKRLPLSHFSPDSDATAGGAQGVGAGLALPPRPHSVDAAPHSPPFSPPAAASSALACPPPEGMMEEVLEAVKMLHYESRFCLRFGLPWLSRDYFVHDFQALRQEKIRAGKAAVGAGKESGRAAALLQQAQAQAESDAAAGGGSLLPAARIAVSASPSPPCAPPTPSQQLLYLGHLVLWLASLLAPRSAAGSDAIESEQLAPLAEELRSWRPYSDYRDPDECESDERRCSLASAILGQISPLRLALPCAALTAPELGRAASGPRVLATLFRLTQAVYHKKLRASVVISPLALRHYPRFEANKDVAGAQEKCDSEDEQEREEEVEEEEGLQANEHDDDDETFESSFGSGGGGGGGGGGGDRSSSALNEAAQLARREAAAAAWMAEWARVCESTALRTATRATGAAAAGAREWQRHRDVVAHHTTLLLSSPLVSAAGGPASPTSPAPRASLSPSVLATRAGELRKLLDRVSQFERRLIAETRFAPLVESHATTRSRLDEAVEAHAALVAANARDAAELDQAEQRLAETAEAVRGAKDRLDDEHGLRALKQTIATMKGEIARFNVLLGVKAAMLQQHLTSSRSRVQR